MWQRNNGQAEDDLQFRFTAYLVSAVKRRRKDYLIQLYKRSSIESTVEVVYCFSTTFGYGYFLMKMYCHKQRDYYGNYICNGLGI